jgi:hypothetical protein
MRVIKRWLEPQTNTLLPPIFGLYSLELEEGRCVNVIVTANLLRMDYPLQEFELNERWYETFLRNDIIGWVVVDQNQV